MTRSMRNAVLAVLSVMTLLVLAGCMSGLKSGTIVIPDSPEAAPPADGNEPFRVKAIYRLPNRAENAADIAYWAGSNALYRLFWGEKGEQTLTEISAPYEKETRLQPLNEDKANAVYYENLSPDGRFLAGFRPSDKGNEIVLTRASNRQTFAVDPESSRLLSKGGVSWSDNGRFLAYFAYAENGPIVCVYDTKKKTNLKVGFPGAANADYFYYVKPSDDGESAVVVTETEGKASLWLGAWPNGEFAVVYEHSVGNALQTAWIDSDRIAFSGTDGTLFTYDRRNEELAVLTGQAGSFQLSPDKQYLAYSGGDAAIYVAKIKGNNLLNAASVYQGIVPGRLSWSPDSASLFVQGWKPYEKWIGENAREEKQPSVVSDNVQSLVIEFER